MAHHHGSSGENLYSLYGHLSSSRPKKTSGEVKEGELIADLAKAEERETMVSHLHFGMRFGQQSDYPRWGDRHFYVVIQMFLVKIC